MIANEFGEAANNPMHRAALIAAGLVLFVLTLIVNAIARWFVRRAERRRRGARPASIAPMSTWPAVRPRRRDRAMRLLLAAATGTALVPLVMIVYYLVKKGLGSWSGSFFTSDPNGNFLGDPGGIKSAILGTIEIVGLATLIAVPLGIGVALYLVEYGRGQPLRRRRALLRRRDDRGAVDRLRPVRLHRARPGRCGGSGFAGWKGSVALSLLMLPIVTRSAEVVLLLVPDSLREAALALGAPRWRVVARVVLPTALPGLVTGSLLAIARGAGETAPLLFTATVVNGTSFDLSQRMNSLPAQIFTDVGQAQDRLVGRAWGAALTLVLMILALTLIARLASRRSRLT